jgi:tetratricopeptide (TPR) repeat protein
MNMGVRQGDWINAAICAGNLSEMELTLGQVGAAVQDVERGVTYADRSNDILQKMKLRAKYADALFTIGRQAKAIELYREAEAMEPWIKPEYPVLFGWVGFHYCDVLLAPAERIAWKYILQHTTLDSVLKMATAFCKAVEEKAAQTLKESEEYQHTTLLDIALDHLALGRAFLYETLMSKSEMRNAKSEIEEAVDGLRRATRLDFLPCGLLSRAMLRFVEHAPSTGSGQGLDGCQADLDEAWQIAERGSMRLFMADVLLHRGRLFRDKAALTEAEKLIDECGYHRRDEELADAQEAAKSW